MKHYIAMKFTDTPCGRTLAKAQDALRELTMGEMTDLLLDNHMEIADSREAREIVISCIVDFAEEF